MAKNPLSPLELEIETQKIVSSSLSKIEVALSEWDSAKRKPEGFEAEAAYMRRFHKALSSWERDSLAGARDKDSVLKRLRRFSDICSSLEDAGVA